MKFIKLEEVKLRKLQSIIDDISSDDLQILSEMELMAIDEVSAYLNGRYDTQAIFSRVDGARSRLIIRIVIDFMVCFLAQRVSGNNIPDYLEETCEKNILLLKDIAKGIISPDLPEKDSDLETTAMFFGSSGERMYNDDIN